MLNKQGWRFNPQLLLIERDYSCVIQWASQASRPPWYLADIIEEVVEISKRVYISFHQIKRSGNAEADRLVSEYPDLHCLSPLIVIMFYFFFKLMPEFLGVVNPLSHFLGMIGFALVFLGFSCFQ